MPAIVLWFFVEEFATSVILNYCVLRLKDRERNLLLFYKSTFVLYWCAIICWNIRGGTCVQHGTEEGYYTMFYASVVLDLLATAFYFKDRKKIAISCLLLEFLPLLLILQHYYCLCDNHAPAQIMLTILKPIMFLVFCVKCSMSAILCTPRLVYEAAKKFIPANRGAWAPRGLVIAYCLFCYLPEMGYFVLHIIYIPFLSLFAAGGL